MKATVHVPSALSRKALAAGYIGAGLRQLDIDYAIHSFDEPPAADSDFVVLWGHKHKANVLARAMGIPQLVMERPAFGNRVTNVSLAWNHPGRLGIRPAPGTAERPKPELAPWRGRQGRGGIVVFDQVPTDIMYARVAGTDWAGRALDAATKFWNKPGLVRPHPQVRPTSPIAYDLATCWLGITYSSTAAVDCVTSGVPAVAVSPLSMAYDVTGHSIDQLVTPDRSEWAHWLSYCQWSLQELEDGTALTHLLRAYDEAKADAQAQD